MDQTGINLNERSKSLTRKAAFLIVMLLTCFGFKGYATIATTAANASICTSKATTGSNPGWTTLGTMTITEGQKKDMGGGSGSWTITLVLAAPTGWQFNSSVSPTLAYTHGIDVTSVTRGTFTASSLTINIAGNGKSGKDAVTITGLQVQPTSTAAPTGSIKPSSVVGSANGVTTTTIFGTLTPLASPATMTGTTNSLCTGYTKTYSDATTGGTWTSSTGSVATVGSTTGIVTPVAAGTTTISYTLSTGCTTTSVVTVNTSPAIISGANNVCTGSTVTLSDATPLGTWTSNNTSVATVSTTSRVVSGVTAGTANISYTLSNGCFDTLAFTVNQAPSPSITGPTSVCTNYTTTLSNATTGGTWSSSVTSKATIDPNTGVVTPVLAGSTTISYTMPGGCATTTVVTVNTSPNSISGTNNVCTAATVTMSDATPLGTWTSSNTSVATISNTSRVVTGVTTGTVNISYTLSTGCFDTLAFTVNQAPSPSITGTTSVCTNYTTTLSNATTGGTWTSSVTSRATIDPNTGVVTPVLAGSTTISYTMPGGCATATVVTVNTSPNSISGNTTLCTSSTITLSDATPLGTWTSGNTSVATVSTTSRVVSGVASGTTNISYTLSTGCFDTSQITVYAPPTAISGSSNICSGETFQFSDAVINGTWSSSNTTVATVVQNTGLVTGVSNGTVNISYSTGCGTTMTKSVIVGNAPITGTLSVCTASTTALSDPIPSGVWSSSNTGVATVVSGTGIVSGASAGTATISYVSGACASLATVTVIATPATISGTAAVCVGLSTTLTDATTNGTWTSSNTSIATVVSNTGAVTGASNGSATITYSTGCGSVAIKPYTVNALPASITGTTSVCVGSTTPLTDVTSTGTWSSSNTSFATVTSTTGIVSGVATGSPTITYTLSSTGCTATTAVTVNPLPAAITGTTSVCAGSTTTLSDVTGSGTWSSNNTSTATVTSTTAVVSGVASGSTTITYTLASTGCKATTPLTVNALPAAITGTASACAGASSTLSDATVTGTWSSSNTTFATVTSTTGIVSAVAAGSPTITYTLSSTGCKTIVTYTVNPLPATITGNTTVCVSSTTTLSDATGSGTWASGTTSIATVVTGSGVVTGVSSGTSILTYKLPTGCLITTSVTVNPLPVAGTITGTTTVCEEDDVAVSDASLGGVWSSDDNTIATIDPYGNLYGVSAGSTTITYAVTNSCGTATVSATVTVNPLPDAGYITGDTILCVGATTTLSASSTGGTGVWSSSANAKATVVAGTGVVTAVSAGAATISYTITNGCGTDENDTDITINAVPTAAPSNSGPGCSGAAVTLSANPGGGADTYAWSGPNLSSTTAQNPTATPTSNSVYSLTVSYGIGNPGCSPGTVYTTTVTTSASNIWLGTTSTAWNLAGNWCGGIPTSSTNVTIPTGAPHFPLVSTGTATAHDITIQSGASLTGSGGTLQISGNVTNSGTFTASAGTVEMNGTAAQSVSGSSISFANLTNSNTTAAVSLNTNINVSGTLNMNGAATILTPSATVVINSGAAAGTISGTGTIQVTRITATADYANQYKFSTNTLTSMTVDYTGAGNQTINSTVGNYGALKTSTSGTKTLAGTVTVNNNLTIGSGSTLDVSASNNTLNVGGSWANNSGTFNARSGAVFMTGTATGLTLSGTMTAGSQFYSLVFLGGSSAAWSFGANPADIGSTFNVSSGTVTAPSTTLTVKGNWYNGATFSNNGGTVVFSQTFGPLLINRTTLTGTSKFNNVTFTGSGGGWSFSIAADIGGNLIIGTGTTVTAPSSTLQVYGSWTNNGTFTNNSGLVFLNNTGAQAIAGSSATSFNSLTIGSGSTTTITTAGQTISNTLISNGTLNTGGFLTLLSTAAKTALIDGSGSGSVLGNVTMQRYLAHGYGYKYISSPFTSSKVGDLSSYINLSATFPTFYSNAESLATAGWIVDTTAANVLKPLQGYAANFGISSSPLTFSLSGVVSNNTVSATLFNHNNTFTLGFNLIGNPYPSPINWTASSGWTKTNIDNAIYYFDASDTDQYTGSYSSYIGGVSSDGIASNIVPAMQGFFIHVSNGTYPVTGTLSATNSVRINNLTPVFHRTAAIQDAPLLRLDASLSDDGTHSDPAVIYFDDRAKGTFDNTLDALKLLNTAIGIPSLYSFSTDETALSIQAVNDPGDSINIIPLGLQIQQDGFVTFNARNIDNMPAGMHIYFYDTKAGIHQDLQSVPQYHISLRTGKYDNRFFLMFTNKDQGQIPVINGTLNAYASGKNLFVYLVSGSGNIVITNTLGQVIKKQEVSGTGFHQIPMEVAAGIYFVTLYSNMGAQSKKIFIGN